MKKGQAAIEFMFLILISIVYLTSVAMPIVKNSQQVMYDTENLSRANTETQKIVNSVTEISLLGVGSKQTLNLYIPENTSLFCNDKNIYFLTQLEQKPFPSKNEILGNCIDSTKCCDSNTGKCFKYFTFASSIDLNCSAIPALLGPAKTKLVIEKTSTKIYLYPGS